MRKFEFNRLLNVALMAANSATMCRCRQMISSSSLREFFHEIIPRYFRSLSQFPHEISINSMILSISPNVCRINNFSLEPISMLHSSFFIPFSISYLKPPAAFNDIIQCIHLSAGGRSDLAILLQHILMIENVHLHNFDIRNIVTC